jgi:hypothetical protein
MTIFYREDDAILQSKLDWRLDEPFPIALKPPVPSCIVRRSVEVSIGRHLNECDRL